MTAWLDPKAPPDVRLLTDAELLRVWRDNRNGVLGLVAADEGMRRLEAREGVRTPRGSSPAKP